MSSYEQAFANLNTAQRQAVEHIDGPVLVIAGPGTGKTQLLTTRIAHILARTDTLPQNILCLTFTESGAQAMRDRLSGLIGQDAYDVTISTYHAFGSDLMRRYPDYFETFGEQPVDDLGADAIFRAIIAALPYKSPLKYADNYLTDIKTLVSDAKRALLTPDDLRAIAAANDAFLAAAEPAVQAALDGHGRIDKKSVAQFTSLLAALEPLAAAGAPTGRAPANGVAPLAGLCLRELESALQKVDELGGKTSPLTAWKNTWLAKNAAGQFVLDGQRVHEKLRVVADVYASYLRALADQHLFDYDDMILRVVRTLETNADLRFTLQEQYLYLLLDEFQDTNGAQLRLVELLTDNPASEGRPNVLAVGDDDQAIYAFQGADYSHMLRFRELYRDVAIVPLTENYRSHADVLRLAGHVAAQIEERLQRHVPGIDKTITAANTSLPQQATIERREAKTDAAQFVWTANRIKQLLASGMPARDIAVLAPQHKYLEPLVPYLQQAGVPVRYEKRENVLDAPGILQLIRMSELCVALNSGNVEQASAIWPEVLSFAFWRLPTSTIWQLSWQASDSRSSWTDRLLANDGLRPIALFFIRLGLLADIEPLETMLDYLIGRQTVTLDEPELPGYRSPFYEFYFDGLQPAASVPEVSPATADRPSTFWHLLSNLTVLRARLRDYRASQNGAPLRLNDFLTFVQAHRAANIKILDTSPYQDADDAVQLMTAFKSKGQEFGAVFLLAANDEAWGSKARTQINHLRLPPNLRFIRYAGATNDERLRLLYVAITRAKTQLYIVNYTGTFTGKPLTRLKYLEEHEDETGAAVSPFLPAGSQHILPVEDATGASVTEQLLPYWQQRHELALGRTELEALLAPRLQTFQLSPTHVNAFTDLVHAGPATFFLDTLLKFPSAPTPQSQFGSAVHEMLEWLHAFYKKSGLPPSTPDMLTEFRRRLSTKSLSAQEQAQLFERGAACLQAWIEQRGDSLGTEGESEYNFRNEGVFIGQAHMGGKIDRLVIDHTAKTISIIDYKTGRSHARWERDVRLHKYRQQLYLYRALVEGSHRFGGYRVTDAYLQFVEPDEDGLIRDLHLAFDEQEFAHVKQIAQAVWRHVQALNMPDVSAYPADLTGITAFETALLREQSEQG